MHSVPCLNVLKRNCFKSTFSQRTNSRFLVEKRYTSSHSSGATSTNRVTPPRCYTTVAVVCVTVTVICVTSCVIANVCKYICSIRYC
jgi:hypothetical protein